MDKKRKSRLVESNLMRFSEFSYELSISSRCVYSYTKLVIALILTFNNCCTVKNILQILVIWTTSMR